MLGCVLPNKPANQRLRGSGEQRIATIEVNLAACGLKNGAGEESSTLVARDNEDSSHRKA